MNGGCIMERKERSLKEMEAIQITKADEMNRIPLDAEGKALAEHKRYTFDIVDTPVDPLR